MYICRQKSLHGDAGFWRAKHYPKKKAGKKGMLGGYKYK
jgi:hypothetical protein